MMTNDDSGAWRLVFTVDTPWSVLEALITTHAQIAVDDLRAQLAQDPELTPRQRGAIMARATPQIVRQTRETFETAWQRLQDERSGTRLH